MQQTETLAPDGGLKSEGRTLIRALDSMLERVLELAITALLVVMVVVAFAQVVLRYAFGAPLSWNEEVARWCFVWMTFLGAALGVKRGAHVSIDNLLVALPPLGQKALSLIGNYLTATVCIALVIPGWGMVQESMLSSTALQWPLKYFFLSIPVGGALMLLYVASRRALGENDRVSGPLVVALAGIVYYLVFVARAVPLPQAEPTVVLVSVLALMLATGVPIAFSVGLAGLLAMSMKPNLSLTTFPQFAAGGVDSFPLLAVPFFILAGELMNIGGITERIYGFAGALVGHYRGGLAQVNVVTSTLIAGLSGSATADCASDSKMLVPVMVKHGYGRAFSCAITAASATIAPIIPPSIGLVIYGATANVSIGRLFLGGYIPGFLMTGALMLAVYLISRRRGYGAGRRRATLREVLREMASAALALLMPLIIVVGIRFGIFTPTEAAAVAVVYATLIIVLVYRHVTAGEFLRGLIDSAQGTAAVMLIIAVASPFAWMVVSEQIPQRIVAAALGLTTNPTLILLMINLLLVVLGCFMEGISIMLILIPILMPVIKTVGIDPVHFGLVMVVNIGIGALTPPFGMLVFVTCAITGERVMNVFREMLPFIAALIAVLLMISYWPALVLLVPNALMGH
ncbi:MAG: TRAP transporter large permease subunit [Candidatus Rokubacteria bacterium]|nr:TRAP transporter large permease subunit [Candidatus Rokubacteria bacterium]